MYKDKQIIVDKLKELSDSIYEYQIITHRRNDFNISYSLSEINSLLLKAKTILDNIDNPYKDKEIK